MSQDKHKDLAERIAKARATLQPPKGAAEDVPKSTMNAGGLALRYGAEFGACVFVGIMLGLLIDWFFKTEPWGVLIMLSFGLAAGVLGVIRAYNNINAIYADKAYEQDVEED